MGAVGQEAALAALSDQAFVRDYLALNRVERAKLEAAFGAMDLPFAPSATNFVFVDVKRSGAAVYEDLLRRGFIVRPMPAPAESWLRISVGLPEENDRMLVALRASLDAIRSEGTGP